MVQENPERLKNYLAMISRREGGIEGVMHKLAARRPREESVEGAPVGPAHPARKTGDGGARNRLRGVRTSRRATMPISKPQSSRTSGRRSTSSTAPSPLPIRCGPSFPRDAKIRARIEAVIPSVGRIELPGQTRIPYGGTGFVVGPGLVMTNRHVAELFAEGAR